MTLIQRCLALLFVMLLSTTALPPLTATAAPAAPTDGDATVWVQLQTWLDVTLDRVAAGLGGFGGTGDDGMGLDPDGGGGGDDGGSSDPPPPDDGSTEGGSSSGP